MMGRSAGLTFTAPTGLQPGETRKQRAGRPRGSHLTASHFPTHSDNQNGGGGHASRVRQPYQSRARLQRRQVRRESIGALVAALGAGIDRALDDAGELRWHIGPRGLNSGPLAALVRTANLAHGPCLHWIRAGDEVIEQDAETVNVAPNRGPVAPAAPRVRDRVAFRRDPDDASSSSSLPVPKSISTMRPSSARITLCALISRCSRPAPCTADTARQSSRPMSTASAALTTFRWSRICSRVWPRTNSIHRPI